MRQPSIYFIGFVCAVLFLFAFLMLPHLPQIDVTVGPRDTAQRDMTLSEYKPNAGAVKAVKARAKSIDWNQYFPKICDDSPDDYPLKVIGACPYSKPMSQPLPFVDVPQSLI